MKITLIGLGAGEDDITRAAEKALSIAGKIIVGDTSLLSFGAVAEYPAEALDEHDPDRVAERIGKIAEDTSVAYCVRGAVCDDAACRKICSAYDDVSVVEGVSLVSAARSRGRMSGGCVTSCPASEADTLKPCHAAVIYDIDSSDRAEAAGKRLSYIFGEDHPCLIISGDGTAEVKAGELAASFVPGKAFAAAAEEGNFFTKERYDFYDLEHVVKLLRAPGGCPWDRAQTNESIKSNMIEEAYELADAIERRDDTALIEEAGDVMLQAVFHAVMREEAGSFSNGDMITELVSKLIFRHSHIFGTDKAGTESEALGVWDRNKAEEKNFVTFSDSVRAVAKNYPACMRAQKIQKRAAKSGMDFSSSVTAADRLVEECRELIQCLSDGGNGDDVMEEAGDILFAAVNTCRLAGVNCEEALAASCDKFTGRFEACETLAAKDGRKMPDMSETELDYYWTMAKNAVKKN